VALASDDARLLRFEVSPSPACPERSTFSAAEVDCILEDNNDRWQSQVEELQGQLDEMRRQRDEATPSRDAILLKYTAEHTKARLKQVEEQLRTLVESGNYKCSMCRWKGGNAYNLEWCKESQTYVEVSRGVEY
jgi:hypothetical protein